MKRSIKYNPKVYTLSALVIGYLLTGDYTANQQNALGNWLMTVGQILECNAAIQQTIEEAFQGNTYNINSKKYKNTGNPYMDNPAILNTLSNDEKEIEEIKKMLNNMLDKLNSIKK